MAVGDKVSDPRYSVDTCVKDVQYPNDRRGCAPWYVECSPRCAADPTRYSAAPPAETSAVSSQPQSLSTSDKTPQFGSADAALSLQRKGIGLSSQRRP